MRHSSQHSLDKMYGASCNIELRYSPSLSCKMSDIYNTDCRDPTCPWPCPHHEHGRSPGHTALVMPLWRALDDKSPCDYCAFILRVFVEQYLGCEDAAQEPSAFRPCWHCRCGALFVPDRGLGTPTELKRLEYSCVSGKPCFGMLEVELQSTSGQCTHKLANSGNATKAKGRKWSFSVAAS